MERLYSILILLIGLGQDNPGIVIALLIENEYIQGSKSLHFLELSDSLDPVIWQIVDLIFNSMTV